jgi:hypothetical protein
MTFELAKQFEKRCKECNINIGKLIHKTDRNCFQDFLNGTITLCFLSNKKTFIWIEANINEIVKI